MNGVNGHPISLGAGGAPGLRLWDETPQETLFTRPASLTPLRLCHLFGGHGLERPRTGFPGWAARWRTVIAVK